MKTVKTVFYTVMCVTESGTAGMDQMKLDVVSLCGDVAHTVFSI